MANDIFIRFKEKLPPEEEIRTIASNFVGPSIGEIHPEHTKEGLFILNLRGVPRSPFEGLPNARQQHFPYEVRWIEFCRLDRKNLTISTRATDEFTNSVATAIGECIARYYQAEFDPGG